MDLNELIDKTHFDYEQNETKAKQLEDRILKALSMNGLQYLIVQKQIKGIQNLILSHFSEE